jgi:hypothetical protein
MEGLFCPPKNAVEGRTWIDGLVLGWGLAVGCTLCLIWLIPWYTGAVKGKQEQSLPRQGAAGAPSLSPHRDDLGKPHHTIPLIS